MGSQIPSSDVLQFAYDSSYARNADDLTNIFLNLLNKHSFHAAIMSGLQRSGADIGTQVIFNNWPENWTEHYLKENYFRHDPVSRQALVSDTPFLWSTAKRLHPANKKTETLHFEASALHMNDGITIPLQGKHFGKYVISLATDQTIAADSELIPLIFFASSYYNIALDKLRSPKSDTATLSLRENEILTWIAAGKTSWETSRILDISERTVHVHLAAIRAKMDVATTTQAVVKALISGQLHL